MPSSPLLRGGLHHPRCPFCHDEVRPEQPKAGCVACMAWQHAACWQDHGRCATCGEPPEGGDRAPDVARRGRPWEAAITLGFGVVTALAVAAALSGTYRLGKVMAGAVLGVAAGVVAGALVVRLARRLVPCSERARAWPVAGLPSVRRDLEALAAEGDVRAMRRLGRLHARGAGEGKDEDAAVAWLQQGAERGDLECLAELAWLLDGRAAAARAERDEQRRREAEEEAARWARTGAEAGSTNAMLRLGTYHLHGWGVAASAEEAATWFRRAAERDDPLGMTAFGWLQERGAGGLAADPVAAATWYRRAAVLGEPGAMVHLASLLERGEGVARDGETAATWYARAAREHEPVAQVLALDAERGDGDDGGGGGAYARASAHLRLGSVLGEDGRSSEARAHLETAMALLPEEAAWPLARVCERLGDPAAAAGALRRAADDPADAAFRRLELARLLALAGDLEQARAELVTILDAEPYAAIWLAALGGDTAPARALARGAGWQATLARLVLGEVSLDAALDGTRPPPGGDEDPGVPRCEALACAGLRADAQGDLDAARRLYEQCVATGADDAIEHAWSLSRLEQLARQGARPLLATPSAPAAPAACAAPAPGESEARRG